MTILIDFDGTCVYHDFPNVGKDIGAAPVLRELVAAGHKLILWTMRCDHTEPPTSDDPNIYSVGGNYLSDAVRWFKDRNIPLYGINTNPTQDKWTSSPKAYGELCIDDINLGARLKKVADLRPFINWEKTYDDLCEAKIIPYKSSVEEEVRKEFVAFIKSFM